jgi:hypothetical protein
MLCMDGSDCFSSIMLLLMLLSFSLAMLGESWVVLNEVCSGSTLSTFCLVDLAFCCDGLHVT